MTTSGIYAIRNTVNGKLYVGSSANVSGRFSSHRSRLNKGIHGNAHLQSAWVKYGHDAFVFELLEAVPADRLIEREQKWIDSLNVANPDFGYNKRKIAESSVGIPRTDADKKRLSLLFKGKPKSPEHRAKIAAALKGKKKPPEQIAKMVESRRGFKHSPEAIAKIAEASRGRVKTLEEIEKTAAAHRGKKRSEQTRANMSAGRQRARLAREMAEKDGFPVFASE